MPGRLLHSVLCGLLLACLVLPSDALIIVRSATTAAGGGGGDLLTDDFENTDGVELTAHGWTADGTACPTDACEIDTAQAQAGTSSALLNHSVDASAYRLFKSIAEQASGTFTVDWRHRFDTLPAGGNEQIMVLTDGAYSFNVTTLVLLRRTTSDIELWNASTWNNTGCSENCVSADTWHHFEIEVNATAETVSVWLDATQIVTDAAFAQSGSIDRVYLQKRASGDSSAAAWVDELRVYSGERVP